MYAVLSEAGYSSFMARRTQPLLTKDVILSLHFDQGLTLEKMARLTGTNARLVKDSFKAHGLQWRPHSGGRGMVRSKETRERISKARRGVKDAPAVAASKRAQLLAVSGWSKGLTSQTDERVAHQRDASAKAMRTPEFRERASVRMAGLVASGKHFERGFHLSPKAGKIYYMSSWELERYLELDAAPQVLNYRRPGLSIPYEWESQRRRYVPDTLIQYSDGVLVLEEVKSTWYAKCDPRTGAKLAAGANFAASQGWGWNLFLRDR